MTALVLCAWLGQKVYGRLCYPWVASDIHLVAFRRVWAGGRFGCAKFLGVQPLGYCTNPRCFLVCYVRVGERMCYMAVSVSQLRTMAMMRDLLGCLELM